jgi:hypothetical protein
VVGQVVEIDRVRLGGGMGSAIGPIGLPSEHSTLDTHTNCLRTRDRHGIAWDPKRPIGDRRREHRLTEDHSDPRLTSALLRPSFLLSTLTAIPPLSTPSFAHDAHRDGPAFHRDRPGRHDGRPARAGVVGKGLCADSSWQDGRRAGSERVSGISQ